MIANPKRRPLFFKRISSSVWIGLLVFLGVAGIGYNYYRVEQRRAEYKKHIAQAQRFCEMLNWPGILSETRKAADVAEDESYASYARVLADQFRRRDCNLPPWPRQDSIEVVHPLP